MSGEITITPGKTFTAGERITEAKLNQAAQPTALMNADSVGSREIINSQIIDTLGESLRGQNLAINAALIGNKWTTPGGVSATVGDRTENAEGWFVNPAGAAVDYARTEASPTAAGRNLWAILVTGATGATTVDVGKFVVADIAAALAQTTFTVSAYIKNDTAAALTPLLRIDTADVRDVTSAVTNRVSEAATTAVPNTEWLRVSWTVDGTTVTNLENGADIVIRMPDTHLDSGVKSITTCMWQLEFGNTATPYVLKTEDVNRPTAGQLVPTGAEFPFPGISAPAGYLLEYGQAISRSTYSELFEVLTATASGTLTTGSPTVTAVPTDLRGLGLVGAAIEGSGIPAATTITAIAATTITLSANATATGAITDIRILPHGAGDGSTTYNLPDARGRVAAGRDDMGGTAASRLTAGSAAAVDGTVLGGDGGAQEHAITIDELAAHEHSMAQRTDVAATGATHATNATGASGSDFTDSVGGDAAHTNVQPTRITNWIIKI